MEYYRSVIEHGRLATMLASALAGLLWYKLGPTAMFLTSAVGVGIVALYIGLGVKAPK